MINIALCFSYSNLSLRGGCKPDKAISGINEKNCLLCRGIIFIIQKKNTTDCGVFIFADRVGFEPTIPFDIRALQARALDQLCDLSNPCGKNYIIRIFKVMKNGVIWSAFQIAGNIVRIICYIINLCISKTLLFHRHS